MQHQIYFCNILMKHMQHTYETHETYGCNMCSSTCWLPPNGGSLMRSSTPEWRLMLRSGVEVADVEVVSSMDLGRGVVGGWNSAATGGASPGGGARSGAAQARVGSVPRAEQAGNAGGDGVGECGVRPSGRTPYRYHRSIYNNLTTVSPFAQAFAT